MNENLNLVEYDIKDINSTFVIYDGSPLIQKDVHSLFKYYKK